MQSFRVCIARAGSETKPSDSKPSQGSSSTSPSAGGSEYEDDESEEALEAKMIEFLRRQAMEESGATLAVRTCACVQLSLSLTCSSGSGKHLGSIVLLPYGEQCHRLGSVTTDQTEPYAIDILAGHNTCGTGDVRGNSEVNAVCIPTCVFLDCSKRISSVHLKDPSARLFRLSS